MNSKDRLSKSPHKPHSVTITPETEEQSNDNWAEVELFRWQYGELPKHDDTRGLDLSLAANRMAEALMKRSIDINTVNAASVIRYLGKVAGAKK